MMEHYRQKIEQMEKYKKIETGIITKDYYIKTVLSGLWGVDFILSYAPVQKANSKALQDEDEALKELLADSYKISPHFDNKNNKKEIRVSFNQGFVALRKTNESYTERFWSGDNRLGCIPKDNQNVFVEVFNSNYVTWLKKQKSELNNLKLRHFIYFDFDNVYEIISTNYPKVSFRS